MNNTKYDIPLNSPQEETDQNLSEAGKNVSREEAISRVYEIYGMTGDRQWAEAYYDLAKKTKSSEEYIKITQEQIPHEKAKNKLKKIWEYVNSIQEHENRSEAMMGNQNAFKGGRKELLSLVQKHREGKITSLELKEMGIYSGLHTINSDFEFNFVKDYFDVGAVIVINNDGIYSEPIKRMEELRPMIEKHGEVCIYNTQKTFDKIVENINKNLKQMEAKRKEEQAEEKKAGKKAGMPETELFDRSSAEEFYQKKAGENGNPPRWV